MIHLTNSTSSIKIEPFHRHERENTVHTITYAKGLTLSLAVSSLDEAIGWYQNVLGFKLLYRMDDIGWCELESSVPDVNVGLSVTEKPTPGGVTPTFGVEDIEDAKTALTAGGARLDGEVMVIEGMVKLLTFFDPDGNTLMFFEDLSQ